MISELPSITMWELTPEARERGVQNTILAYEYPKPPWLDCPADEFINYWLAGWDNGTIRRPTLAELAALDNADPLVDDEIADDDEVPQ